MTSQNSWWHVTCADDSKRLHLTRGSHFLYKVRVRQGLSRVRLNKLWYLLAVTIAIFAACGTSADTSQSRAESVGAIEGEATASRGSPPAVSPEPTVSPEPAVSPEKEARRETIIADISLYLVVDNLESPNPAISSHRCEGNLREILDVINEIWRQAGIRFDAKFVGTVEVPVAVLQGVARGELQTFFAELGNSFVVPQPSTINGFYIRDVGGANGINPFRSRAFFVIDEPSVHDCRVSSHEIGHIFGLHHVRTDSNRLLFSGTNGMTLTENEATVARYVAQGILAGVR